MLGHNVKGTNASLTPAAADYVAVGTKVGESHVNQLTLSPMS